CCSYRSGTTYIV
nr:immunoglobulin light chain junction region [Macaca mulatta]